MAALTAVLVTAVETLVVMVRLVAAWDKVVSEVVPMEAVQAAERLGGSTPAFRRGMRLDMNAGG